MKKILMSVLIFFLALFAFVILFRNWIIEAAMEQAVSRLTGFPTEVGKVQYDFPSQIEVRDLKIHNPKGFENDVFADVPEIFMNLDFGKFLKKEIYLHEVRLNLQQINLERNTEGVSNVQLLSSVAAPQKTQAPSSTTTPPQPAEPSIKPAPAQTPMPFYLKKLVLTLRHVSFEDRAGLLKGVGGAVPKPIGNLVGNVTGAVGSAAETAGGVIPEKVKEAAGKAEGALPEKMSVDMNIQQQVFTDIKDPKALVNLILVKIAYGTTFGKLMGINPEALFKDTLQDFGGQGKELFAQSSATLSKEMDRLASQFEGIAGQGVTTQAKEQISGIFSKFKAQLGENSGASGSAENH